MNRYHQLSPLSIGFLVILTALFMLPPQVLAQLPGQPQPLPRREYYQVFPALYQGEYRAVGRQMQSLSRSAYRDANGYFLDSVCYWTILGESLYRLGEYSQALEQYEAALKLYVVFQNWPARTRLPNAIQTDSAGTRRSNVPWANTTRRFTVGKFDNSMLVLLGKSDRENEAVLREGGVIDQARWRTVDMAEVMRCAALALHRRREIKGPTCQYDPLTKQLATSLADGGDGSIPGAWRGVLKGIAKASLEDWNGAAAMLTSSLQCVGTYDHPLTPVALMELGYVAQQQQQWQIAEQMYLEASISAAAFNQFDMIEEGLRSAANVFAVGRNRQPYPPLESAVGWAKREKADPMQASLLIQAAMVSGEAGDAAAAHGLLEQARREMSGNDLRQTALMQRWAYVSAMAYYLNDDVRRGDEAMDQFVKNASQTSLWLFQLGFADSLVQDNRATKREAEMLYDAVLREPNDNDWLLHPIETMAYQLTPHFLPMERWFEISLDRNAKDKAINVAELVRRQRFFSTLPFGGRLLALRWVLEAPDEALTEPLLKRKQELLIRYPAYKQLVELSDQLRQQIEQLPLVPNDKSDEKTQQTQLLEELARVVEQQETILRKIALQREPCELAFPPMLSMNDVQQRLSAGQLIVSLLKIGPRYYLISLGAERYALENVIDARALDRAISTLLKQIGVSEKAAIYEVDIFQDEEWRETARKITELIFAKSDPQSISSIDEIIFIPDGRAWYLPMELLQYGTAEESVNLNQKTKVRYAPLTALAVPDGRAARRFRRTGVVAKSNFTRDDESMIQRGLEQLRLELPDLITIEKALTGPSSLISSTIDQLLVWHENKDVSRSGPYSMAPMQLDQGTAGADLSSWIMLPWRGIDQIALTGYSSNIEGSTRNRANGEELFLTTCSLMASGARTVLISRWRVGGQSTLDLTREFFTQLGERSASDSWHRSVRLLTESDLNLDLESRVRKATLDAPMKADHPFFWSGYMLVDMGTPVATGDNSNADQSNPEQPDQK